MCPTLRALTIDQLTPPHVHNIKPVVQYNSVRFTALPIDNLKPSHVHRMKLAHKNKVAMSNFSTKNAAFSKDQNTGYEVSFDLSESTAAYERLDAASAI